MNKCLDHRNSIKEMLRKHLIGPLNETFLSPDNEEIITAPPVSMYFSGMTYPKSTNPIWQEEDDLDGDIDQFEIEDCINHNSDNVDQNLQLDNAEASELDENKMDDFTNKDMYPSTFGISFCLSKHTLDFDLNISFGIYNQLDPRMHLNPNFAIPLSIQEYDAIKTMNTDESDYLGNLIGYDSVRHVAYLKRTLKGQPSGKRDYDYACIDIIRRKVNERFRESKGDERENYRVKSLILEKITCLYRNSWIRTHYVLTNKVPLSTLTNERKLIIDILNKKISKNSNIVIKLYINLVKETSEYIHVKAMIANESSPHPADRYKPNNEALNKKTMFQCSLEVESDGIIALPNSKSIKHMSIEEQKIECLYRNVKSYAMAHNCSCEWDNELNVKKVRTEYLPSSIPPVSTNNDDMANLETSLNIKNNSYVSELSDIEILDNLYTIHSQYKLWIEKQETFSFSIPNDYASAIDSILHDQKQTLMRLFEGIELIRSNKDIFHCYKLSNTTMFVNMIVSNADSPLQNSIAFLSDDKFKNFKYHLFQIVFFLINIKGIVDPESSDRNNIVDLLWFPTGGGKTEAYLLIASFTMIWRRLTLEQIGLGTSVIMRYTLRLLTAQQFDRAARLILSLNFCCSHFAKDLVSDKQFSIGLWIGEASSPNKIAGEYNGARANLESTLDGSDIEEARKKNNFPIDRCPWCKSDLIQKNEQGMIISGFNCLDDKIEINCLNKTCLFHNGIPIDFVDESLYNNPPTLLFATIDKFAQLAWKPEARSFFGLLQGYAPPDLIIQDELHLISGPLGTITALFEAVVEMLCTNGLHKPKLVASTATIKNSSAQIVNMYENRKVFTFPPPGLGIEDNFFAKLDPNNHNREYVGIYPTGKTFVSTQVKLIALTLLVRWQLYQDSTSDIDNYWTLVSYHNSLRELGRMFNKSRDEIQSSYSQLFLSKYPYINRYPRINYPRELTSRITGYGIKAVLHKLEEPNINPDDFDGTVDSAIDLVYATNMISVGLDIDRLNLIIVNGQPRCTSEYIQVTSRIARHSPGLVIAVFNQLRIRDRSHFECFKSFHNSFYKHIEPISITPFTKVAIWKMVPTMLAAYLRINMKLEKPSEFEDHHMDAFTNYLRQRISDPEIFEFFKRRIAIHIGFLKERVAENPKLSFKDLLIDPNKIVDNDPDDRLWLTMQSMREISPNSAIQIIMPKSSKKRNKYD